MRKETSNKIFKRTDEVRLRTLAKQMERIVEMEGTMSQSSKCPCVACTCERVMRIQIPKTKGLKVTGNNRLMTIIEELQLKLKNVKDSGEGIRAEYIDNLRKELDLLDLSS